MSHVKDANGKFKWVLKYPDTIVPAPEEPEPLIPQTHEEAVSGETW